jgi:hypothetical protein
MGRFDTFGSPSATSTSVCGCAARYWIVTRRSELIHFESMTRGAADGSRRGRWQRWLAPSKSDPYLIESQQVGLRACVGIEAESCQPVNTRKLVTELSAEAALTGSWRGP